jgi:hypothetical protein
MVTWRGTWTSGTTYALADQVGYSTTGLWQSLQATNTGHTPVAGSWWELIRAPSFQGQWSSATDYVPGDIVGTSGHLWTCLLSNVNVTPVAGSTWALLRVSGEQGTWVSTTEYAEGDQIEYRGGIWTAALASLDVVPAVGSYWTLVQSAPFDESAAQAEMTGQARGVELLPVYGTSGRPSAWASGAGAVYYDATLNKPGFSDGTVWKDAGGTTI